MQFHISVYQLRSPRIEDNRTDFTSIEFNIYQSRFTVWRKRHISRILHMPVQNAVSLNGSKNTICFTWSALEMSRFASWLYERGIFYVNCIQFFCLKRRLSKWLEERNIYQGFRAGNGLLCFRALRMRHISPILYFIFLCKAYFCFEELKNEASFKSFTFDMGCSAPWL